MTRKILLNLLIGLFVLGLTGCKTNSDLAKETLYKNINKDCESFDVLVSNDFGGGEGESHGVTEIGYCDGKLAKVRAVSESSSAISRKFNYSIYEFEYPNDKILKTIFENNLFKVNKSETTNEGNLYGSLSIDLVVNETKLNELLNVINNNFIPLVSDSINEDNISIYIYTTVNDNINSDEVLISYLIEEDSDFRFYETEKYNLVEYIGNISAYGYDTINNVYQENIIEQLNKSLNDLKIKNNL